MKGDEAVVVDLVKTDLAKLRDSELDDEAQRVHDVAAALQTEKAKKMAEYGLGATTLTDLQSAITAFSALVGSPRAAIGGKTGITAAIEAEFARGDGILSRQLDRLIVQFEKDNAQFVAAYWAARKLVPAGSRASSDKSPTSGNKPAPAPAPALQPVG